MTSVLAQNAFDIQYSDHYYVTQTKTFLTYKIKRWDYGLKMRENARYFWGKGHQFTTGKEIKYLFSVDPHVNIWHI